MTLRSRTSRPLVVMAHGLGSQKDMGLHAFAEALAAAGLATLAFDYRTFGGSDGEPRHSLDQVRGARHIPPVLAREDGGSLPRHSFPQASQLQDWQASVDHARAGGLGPDIDPDKIALWGISLSGGRTIWRCPSPTVVLCSLASLAPRLPLSASCTPRVPPTHICAINRGDGARLCLPNGPKGLGRGRS